MTRVDPEKIRKAAFELSTALLNDPNPKAPAVAEAKKNLNDLVPALVNLVEAKLQRTPGTLQSVVGFFAHLWEYVPAEPKSAFWGWLWSATKHIIGPVALAYGVSSCTR